MSGDIMCIFNEDKLICNDCGKNQVELKAQGGCNGLVKDGFIPSGSDKGEAGRYNQGKAKLSLIMDAPNAVAGISQVLEFGAQKY